MVKKILRVLILFALFFLGAGVYSYKNIVDSLPDNIKTDQNYTLDCKLCNLITVKSVSVEPIERKKIVPSGQLVGIYVETDGVMILGTGEVTGINGDSYEPAKNIVKSGDYIKEVNGESVFTKYELSDKINKYAPDNIVLTINRNEEIIHCKIKPVNIAPNDYKLGIWVRDNAVGIGTLTFYNNNEFGALGHGITDIDTGILMDISKGRLYNTEIVSVTKGETGTPGQITGVINYGKKYAIGEINSNTDSGVKGSLYETSDYCDILNNTREPMEIAFKQEIEKGPASILCSVDGEVKGYSIEITGINLNESYKGLEIKVTDEALLNQTGGIIQGLSGSPILQNGRIVGAVTHVFVDNPTKGYGIFIENML